MSYHKEWDDGKDWNQYGDYNQQRNTRGRDDDEYYGGSEKRRKYNDNGESSYGSGSGNGNWNPSHGQDYGDQSYDDRRGGHRRRLVPSEATQHVIFLGLDLDHTEGDLQAYLQGMGCSLDSVTIIRDRSTGLSKGFGFAQFTSVEQAKVFLQPNFPFINIPPPASHGASALAAWKQVSAGGGQQQQQGRRIKIDFSQSAHNSDRSRGRMPSNDGTRDIGTSPAPVILLRGIDGVTTPAAVAVALRLASGPGREGAKGLKRVLLIKDKMTGLGSGFAFLEFVDQASASSLLASLMSPQLHPTGFRVNDKPVAASYAHPFSFQLLSENELRDDATVPSSKHLGGGDGFLVRYWDEGSSIAEMTFAVEEPEEVVPAATEKKKKKVHRAGESEVSAFLGSVTEGLHAAEMAVSALPVSDKPVTLSLKKTGIAVNKPSQPTARVNAPALGFGGGDADEGDEDDAATHGIQEDERVASAKKIAPLIASKKVVNSISKWNSVQEELSGKVPFHATAPVETVPGLSSDSSRQQALIAAPTEQIPIEKIIPEKPLVLHHPDFEYADSKKMACYLCSRQFKSLEQLQRHNKESDLHKKNLHDPSLREVARKKALASSDLAGGEGTRYRDRAQERRALHNQPDVPMPEDGGKAKRKIEAPAVPPPPIVPVAPAKDESNIGNKLLQKMGWAQGMGLGAEGEGRVDPIETAIYAQGAGLGASKGKEIGKFADGYSGYVNMAKDAARDRYDEKR